MIFQVFIVFVGQFVILAVLVHVNVGLLICHMSQLFFASYQLRYTENRGGWDYMREGEELSVLSWWVRGAAKRRLSHSALPACLAWTSERRRQTPAVTARTQDWRRKALAANLSKCPHCIVFLDFSLRARTSRAYQCVAHRRTVEVCWLSVGQLANIDTG